MDPIRIDIPDARPDATPGQRTVEALRAAGCDPARAVTNPIIGELAKQFTRGLITREEFVRSVGKLMILNPRLRATP